MSAEVIPFAAARRPRGRRRPSPTLTGIPYATAWDSWEIALNGRNRSEGTIRSYRETVELFTAWREQEGLADDVEQTTPEEVRRFLTAERERTSPGNAAKLFRNLRALFGFLIKEGERTAPSPVQGDDEPHVPDEEMPVLSDEEIKAVLATCTGTSFRDRRDNAMLRLFLDCGPRSSGMVGIRYTPRDEEANDVLLSKYRIRIVLKGGDALWVPIGRKTAQALDRYIRARAKHSNAHLAELWIGHRGAMTRSGVQQMMRHRGEQAGISGLSPHWWRRSSAIRFLRNGGSEEEAMYVYGWKSTAMVRHYARNEAKERARQAHAKYSPGDQF